MITKVTFRAQDNDNKVIDVLVNLNCSNLNFECRKVEKLVDFRGKILRRDETFPVTPGQTRITPAGWEWPGKEPCFERQGRHEKKMRGCQI